MSTPNALKIVATRGDREFLEDVPIDQLPALLRDPTVHVWVDSWGEDNPDAEALARDLFRFHPMVVSDCFEAREHPKVEEFEDYVFLIVHGIAPGSRAEATDTVELDVFIGQRMIFTYHERPSRSVSAAQGLVERNRGGPLRRHPAAVLHAILDRQVESMEPLLDDLELHIEELEDQVMGRPTRAHLVQLLALKRTTLQLRRWMSKQREVVLRLARREFAVIDAHDAVLFRDAYDHLTRYTDLLETHREMITSLQETYLSVTNLRLGEIMKFLTLFTAVLMPLTVITGIYGMNFDHMPELRERLGYPIVLGVMLVVASVILLLFRRRGWLGAAGELPPPPPPRRSGTS